MNPEEEELLNGMVNCYRVCGEDFEGTVRMVSGARGRDTEEVKETLKRIATDYGNTDKYKKFREKIPEEFPF